MWPFVFVSLGCFRRKGSLLLSAHCAVCSDVDCVCLENEASFSNFNESTELASRSPAFS